MPSLDEAVHQYLEHKQAQVDAGEIKPGAKRDAETQLKTFLIYCKLEGITRISDSVAFVGRVPGMAAG